MKVSKSEQLKWIKDTVADLTATLENLKVDIQDLEEDLSDTPSNTPSREFVVGDYLEITHNYLGKKGTFRKVVSTTNK